MAKENASKFPVENARETLLEYVSAHLFFEYENVNETAITFI